MKVELVLQAVDRASRTIAAVENGLGRLAQAQERVAAATNAARADFFDKLAAGAAAVAPIIKANAVFAEFEDKLTDVGLKGELSGAKLKALGDEIIALAPKVNRTSAELLAGIDKLVEGGMKIEPARQVIADLGKTSVATKATMDDLGKTAVTLVNNMKIAPPDIIKALDGMAQSGKEGQFELKAMAEYFPRLGAQYAAMGQTGVKAAIDLAAMLQIIRGQTGRDETAVVALEDMLNKITLGPAKKKFEELGIDIVDVMEKAKKSGTVFETMFEVLTKATGGDAGKLSDLFSDKQALAGVRALMQEYGKFIEIRKKALAASGVVDADFSTRMKLQVESMKRLENAMNAFWLAIGSATAPYVAAVISRVADALQYLTGIVQAYPQATAWLLGFAAAVAGLGAILAAAKLGMLIFGSALISIARASLLVLTPLKFLWAVLTGFFGGIVSGVSGAVAAFGGWSVVLAGIGARIAGLFRFLLAPLAMASRAVMAFGAILLATPLGWFIAGIAAVAGAAYLIYQNWGQIGPWLASLWETIKATMVGAWNGMVDWLAGLGGRIGAAISGGFASVGSLASTVWDAIIVPLKAGWAQIEAWFASLKWPALPKFEFLDTISAGFDTLVGKIEAGWAKVKALFSSFKLPSISLPSWMGGSGIEGAASVAATAEQASAAKAAVDAIAPAAVTAVTHTTATFSGVSFYSQGVAMMETLATGIRAGAASAVAAARDTVQKIRDHLPHSPAKVGPLSDLDRVQFGQTLATAISAGAPAALGAARAIAAGLAATVPAGMTMGVQTAAASTAYLTPSQQNTSITPSSVGSASGGQMSVSVTFAPTIQGGSSGDVMAQLRAHSYELVQMIQAELDRRQRTKH